MRIKSLNKIFDIFVISASLWLIAVAVHRYFILRIFSLEEFILIVSFFFTCLIGAFLIFFGKISSLKDIIKNNNEKNNDLLFGMLGMPLGIIGLYMGIFLYTKKTEKILSIIGGIFFLILATFCLLSKFFKNKKEKKGVKS